MLRVNNLTGFGGRRAAAGATPVNVRFDSSNTHTTGMELLNTDQSALRGDTVGNSGWIGAALDTPITGKGYVEFVIDLKDASVSDTNLGIVCSTDALNVTTSQSVFPSSSVLPVGNLSNCGIRFSQANARVYGTWTTNDTPLSVAAATNDILMVAVDQDNGRFWTGLNGSWTVFNSGAVPDEGSQANWMYEDSSIPSGGYLLAMCSYSAATPTTDIYQMSIAATQTYTPPTGYTPYVYG